MPENPERIPIAPNEIGPEIDEGELFEISKCSIFHSSF
jgi:hypothetical protein